MTTKIALLITFTDDRAPADAERSIRDHLMDTYNDDETIAEIAPIKRQPSHLLNTIAAMTPDGECMNEAHAAPGGGLTCDGGSDECEPFDMTSDDAVSTLNNLIAEARLITR